MTDNSLMKKGYIPRLTASNAFGGYASRLHSLKGWHFFEQRWARVAAVSVIVLLSLCLLGYGIWLLQLERGSRAVAHGELDAATDLGMVTVKVEQPHQSGDYGTSERYDYCVTSLTQILELLER